MASWISASLRFELRSCSRQISKTKYFSQVAWHVALRSGQSGLHGFSNNVQCLLDAVSAAGDSTGVTHSVQKFLLIRARMLTRQLHFYVDGPSIRNAVAPDIGLAVLTNMDDTAVFRKELADGVVPSDAAVLTESHDDFVLEYGFGVNNDRLPDNGWRSGRSELFWKSLHDDGGSTSV